MNDQIGGIEPGSGVRAQPRLTVVSGPSGVGKSSVVSALSKLCPDVFLSVSVTTRAPRRGEVDGDHYHFIDKDSFQEMIAAGELLEHAEYAGNHYGTPRGPVRDAIASGRPALLEIELQGARQVRKAEPDAQLVMLAPPNWDTLVERLTGRGTEDPHIVAARLAVARHELGAENEFDVVVVNADVQTAARELLTLVLGSSTDKLERC